MAEVIQVVPVGAMSWRVTAEEWSTVGENGWDKVERLAGVAPIVYTQFPVVKSIAETRVAVRGAVPVWCREGPVFQMLCNIQQVEEYRPRLRTYVEQVRQYMTEMEACPQRDAVRAESTRVFDLFDSVLTDFIPVGALMTTPKDAARYNVEGNLNDARSRDPLVPFTTTWQRCFTMCASVRHDVTDAVKMASHYQCCGHEPDGTVSVLSLPEYAVRIRYCRETAAREVVIKRFTKAATDRVKEISAHTRHIALSVALGTLMSRIEELWALVEERTRGVAAPRKRSRDAAAAVAREMESPAAQKLRLASDEELSNIFNCAICHDMAAGAEIRLLNCAHRFCAPCIAAARHYRPECPICKTDITGSVIDHEAMEARRLIAIRREAQMAQAVAVVNAGQEAVVAVAAAAAGGGGEEVVMAMDVFDVPEMSDESDSDSDAE